MYRGNIAKYCEISWNGSRNMMSSWQTPIPMGGSLHRQRQTGLILGNRAKRSFRSGRSLITLLFPSTGKQGAQWQGIVVYKIYLIIEPEESNHCRKGKIGTRDVLALYCENEKGTTCM